MSQTNQIKKMKKNVKATNKNLASAKKTANKLAAEEKAKIKKEAKAAGKKNAENIIAADSVTGMPKWKPRELKSEYLDSSHKGPTFDVPFLVITLVILAFGLIMLFSASYARQAYTPEGPLNLFTQQLIFAVLGIVIMFVTARVPVSVISRWSMVLLLVSIVFLVAVLFLGVRVNGATRWMGIGGERGFRFQPSEVAKLAIVLAFAHMMCRFGKRMATFKYGVMPFAVIALIMMVLLYLQPHLSGAMIIAILTMIMLFAGGTRIRWFLLAGAFAVVVIIFMSLMSLSIQRTTEVVNDEAVSSREIVWDFSRFGYAGRRINSWIDPETDPLFSGYQVRQSLNAVGSGGLLGQGLGQSRQKHLHLPEEHNDFIFAIIGEELGFIGSMLILMLFVLLIVRGYWLALNAKDRYSWLITIGIISLLAIQVFLNVAVVTNMIPATGISLPFFSYGGTALLVQMFQMGIVLAVSREIPTAVQYERRMQYEEDELFAIEL